MYYQIPEDILKRDGPFNEFKQDVSIVSVELENGKIYSPVLILFPNYIISMKDLMDLPFNVNEIKRVFQSQENIKMRSSSDWIVFPHPWDNKNNIY